MANVFDQFDEVKTESNPFDQFDEIEEPKKKSGFFSDLAKLADSDPVIGGAENLLSILSGSISDAAAGLSGLVGGGNVDERSQRIANIKEGGTYQPRSASGADVQSGLGEALQPVGEAMTATERFLGDTTLDVTGSPAAAAAAATLPTATLELLGLKGTRGLKKVTPENVIPEAEPTLKETGIRSTVGEATQDLGQQKSEQFLLEQSSEGGDQLRGYKLAQSREIRDYLEGVKPEEVDNVGQSVQDAIRLRKNSSKYKRKLAYDKLADLTKDIDVRLDTNTIYEAGFADPADFRDFRSTNPQQAKAIEGIIAEFGLDLSDEALKGAAKEGIEIQELSVSNAERMRKRLNNIEKSDPTGNTSRFTGPMKDALDSEFDLASKALQENGNPDISRAAKEARQSHAALKTEFDEKGLTSQLIDNKSYQSKLPKIEESQVYAKLVTDSTPIESFSRVIKSLDRAGTRGSKAKNQIKAQMVMDLIDSGFNASTRKIKGERVFGANAFAKRFDKLEPKLKSIMTDTEFKQLSKLRNDANDLVPPSGAMPKGSAGFFIEALNKAGIMGMMNAIPYAGPATADFLTKIGKTSQDAKAFERAVQSSPEIKDAINLLSTDYPSLAVALDIPLVREDEEE